MGCKNSKIQEEKSVIQPNKKESIIVITTFNRKDISKSFIIKDLRSSIRQSRNP